MTTESLPPLEDLYSQTDEGVTHQLPAEEPTVDDLEEEYGAEATGEIELGDIIEVADAMRTSRMTALVLRTPPAEPAYAAPPARPTLQQPSSIAPIAIDLIPQPPRDTLASIPDWGESPVRESTIEIARAAGIPSRASRMVVFTGAVLGACVIAASVGAMLGYSHTPSSDSAHGAQAARAADAPPLHTTPRIPVITAAHEEITEAPILVAGKDASASGTSPEARVVVAVAELPAFAPPPIATPVVTAAARPVARPMSSFAAAPAPAATPVSVAPHASATGVIRIPGSVPGVLLDGAPHRVGNGTLVVTCGHHTVKSPGQPAHSVMVPCGGVTSL